MNETLISEFRYENYKTFVVEIFLLSKCQLKCPYCFVNNEFKEKEFQYKDYNYNLKEFEKFLNALNYITEYKNIKFLFMGGEPTIHPQYFEIINLIRSTIDRTRKISIKSMTNGIKLYNRVFRRKAELYSDFLQFNFSFHFQYFNFKLLDILNNIENNVKFKVMYDPKYRDIIYDIIENKRIKSNNVIINKLYHNGLIKEFFNYTKEDTRLFYKWNYMYENIKNDYFYKIKPDKLFKKTSYLCVFPNGYFLTRNKYKKTINYPLNIYLLPEKLLISYLNKNGSNYGNGSFYLQQNLINEFNYKFYPEEKKLFTFYDLGIGPVT